tara:strand:+ start:249 stop:1082 length:834 start_codon:yes stop_codon:yes gene_type:complete
MKTLLLNTLIVFILFLATLSNIKYKRITGHLDIFLYSCVKQFNKSKINKIMEKKTDNIKLPVFKVINDSEIPKIIHQTHKDINLIPKYYIENLKKLNKGWKYNFHDNKKSREFLSKFYGESFVKKFDSLNQGPHKADLWRLCVLYKTGGCYIDADIEMKISFDEIIKNSSDNLIIPCSKMINCKERLFNALIICKPMDERIRECIKKIMLVENRDLESFYHLNLEIMGEILKNKIEYSIYEEYLPKNNINILLSPKDCYIVSEDKKILAKSKRNDFI